MPDMSVWAPKPTGVRDPRDKTKRNGMFWNPVRFLKFGGARGNGVAPDQTGTVGIDVTASQQAAGPITDRGKGRR